VPVRVNHPPDDAVVAADTTTWEDP
jgi:hypothetical protein